MAVKRFLTVLLCLLLLVLSSPALALDVPPLQGRVNDTAAMFSGPTVTALDSLLSEFETTDSTQIVVLTVPSLDGDLLEDFSMRVVEAWKIGQKGLDNGALLLITRDDRRLRIEVGYGLEGSLTDLIAGRIIGQVIVPRFKEGKFNAGVTDGVQAMIAAVRGEFTASQKSENKGGDDPAGLIFLVIIGFAFLGKILHGKKRAAALIGAVALPVVSFFMLPHFGLLLLFFIPLGALAGMFFSSVSSTRSGGFYMGGGGFGGSSGGFGGGFSGGGGGFGGGGASGGW